MALGASKWQILSKVILPGSVPTMIAALKVNAGLSLVGVVVGEFQSAIGAGCRPSSSNTGAVDTEFQKAEPSAR